jgi:hypothetical protein
LSGRDSCARTKEEELWRVRIFTMSMMFHLYRSILIQRMKKLADVDGFAELLAPAL